MAVLNDFEACGYGVPALRPEDLLVLNDVPARRKVRPAHNLDRTEQCTPLAVVTGASG